MTKPKPRPERAVDAVKMALSKELSKRPGGLKPIEIVKVAICAFQSFANADALAPFVAVESDDRSGLRRGTQAAIDRLLFNANYWLNAYEDRIVEACSADDAKTLLKAVTVWSTHTLKLNTLGFDETISTFERFCPPFAANNRKGAGGKQGKGKGPIAEFENQMNIVAERNPELAGALNAILDDMRTEAEAYAAIPSASALDSLFAILPAWCLQDRIGLVSGGWWEDADVMAFLADALKKRFVELGYGEAPCQYFHDSLLESIDAYQRDVTSSVSPLANLAIPELLQIVHAARGANPNYEADGYGEPLPPWLIAKEQLIWNTLVCSLYGPGSARPLLSPLPEFIARSSKNSEGRTDVITGLAKSSFKRYSADRAATGADRGYESFSDQPQDLRNSSIEHIKSIPWNLDVLGYEIMPDGSCNPDQRVASFSPSEIECLAVLEHRRWIAERTKAGWTHGKNRDVDAKKSPYLVPWEELPDRAREWNRSAIRNIPALLASEYLAIARK